MIAVSDALKTALVQHRSEATREVAYKRRLWDAATRTYGWEAAWTVVDNASLVSVATLNAQLDSEQLNEFKVSNATVVLQNRDNRWREDNPFGVFARDSGSPLYPYNPYWTKFRVRVAVRLPDGTDEYVTMFTGVAVELTYASNDQVQVTVQGLESLLMNTSAEDVSTEVLEENAGTGNGILTAFVTANPGVGIIDEVSVAGVRKTAGTDYDVSDLDAPTTGATVTFTTPPASGTVRISYRYWQQNKRIEELVEALLTAAGISEASQDVDPVIFSAPIQNAVVIDAQADWQAGTPTSIDYNAAPGSIKVDIFDAQNYELLDDFSDGELNSPLWTFTGSLAWSLANPSPGVYRLRYDKPSGSRQGVGAVGTTVAQIGRWEWECNGFGPSFDKVSFGFMCDGFVSMTTFPFEPYSLRGNYVLVRCTPYASVQTWDLYLRDVLVASADYTAPASGSVVIVVKRYANGLTQVFVDGNLIVQGQSVQPTAVNQQFGIGSERGAFIITDREFGYFKVPRDTFNAQWASPTYDLSAGVISVGKLIADYHVGGGTVVFQTRASANGSSWGAWTNVAANGQVQSDVLRYLQVRVTFTHNAASYDEPIVHSVRVEYQTTVATITLAKFTGQTVYEAIQALGRFSNYEWGFTADELFFFRAKAAARQAVEDLVREGDVVGVSGMTTGYDRVYSEVSITYGNFTARLVAPGDQPEDPKARFGTKVFELSVGDIIIGNDADVASGVAKLFFKQLSRPKRRFKASCRFLPYVELSDVLFFSFDQNRQRKDWHLGDETVHLGDRDVSLWGPGEQIVSEMYAKVIGVRQDVFRYASEFDLEEVP